MKKFRSFTALLLAALLLLSFTGCSPDYLDAYIYFELENRPSTLDPQLVSTREEQVIVRSIFDTLMRYDENGILTQSAAASFEKNGLTYTFKIREDATWKEGEPLTAYDFEFAFKRALDPETAAPAVSTLSAVESCRAVDAATFSVTLKYDDPDFLKTMASPIAMPCNEKFFNECKGMYGLTIETTPSCGSYYIRKWPTEDKFLIRLAKNLEFKGEFEARSMRVYFTADERSNAAMLLDGDTDLAFVPIDEVGSVGTEGITLSSLENTTYMLFLSPSLDSNIRSALHKSVKIAPNTFVGFTGCITARSIAPSSLGCDLPDFAALYPYDIATASSLYQTAVLENSELNLKGLTLKVYSDPAAVAAAKSIVAHWQQNLGAFMNIEEISSLESLRADYKSGSYTAIIMPVTADFSHTSAYLSNFVTESVTAEALQKELGDGALGTPLFCASSYTAARTLIENFQDTVWLGIPDVALAEKHE